jgi:uncharacterized membrane protein (DUF485 family)
MLRMSLVAFGCLLFAGLALAMCCAAWYRRFFPSGSDEQTNPNHGRFDAPFAQAALLCATSSAAIYVAFLLLWAYSQSFNGRQPLGAAAIWLGVISSVYAIVGGLFARGVQRLLIVASSLALTFLWMFGRSGECRCLRICR